MAGRRFRHPDIQYAKGRRHWVGAPGRSRIRRRPGDPNHIAYRSVYSDASLAETLDPISATEYTLHATVRSGGKTITSVDTCLRSAR